jgi:hypothetical protein
MRINIISLFVVLALALSINANAQNYRNKELSLISYNFSISPNLRLPLNSQAHLFPETKNKKADKVVALTKDRTWDVIKERLESETGMYILPLNSHGSSFKYDQYNFPNVPINRAIRVGSSRYYLRVDMNLSAAPTGREGGYGTRAADANTDSEGITPQVTITVTTYSDKGVVPQHRFSKTLTAEKAWILGEENLNGITNHKEYQKNDTSTILGLVNMALNDIISNFKTQQ